MRKISYEDKKDCLRAYKKKAKRMYKKQEHQITEMMKSKPLSTFTAEPEKHISTVCDVCDKELAPQFISGARICKTCSNKEITLKDTRNGLIYIFKTKKEAEEFIENFDAPDKLVNGGVL